MNDALSNILAATGTGAMTGAGLGGVGAMMRGTRSPTALLLAALKGAGGAGALTGGSTALGTGLLGNPTRREDNPYTTRGAVGGGAIGAAAGGGLGGLISSGYLARNPEVAGVLKQAMPVSTNNLIGDLFKYLAKKPTLARTLLGGGAGAMLGGMGAGYLGASEGMGVDAVDSQMRR